jgi:hypothetical protein
LFPSFSEPFTTQEMEPEPEKIQPMMNKYNYPKIHNFASPKIDNFEMLESVSPEILNQFQSQASSMQIVDEDKDQIMDTMKQLG